MSMSRRDYEAIAAGFCFSKPNLDIAHPDALEAWHNSVQAVAEALGQRNTNFDHDKFYTACGIDPEDA